MKPVLERTALVSAMLCDRCGIDVPQAGLCVDCSDVLQIARIDKSTPAERAQAREWIEMGIPVREVAGALRRKRDTIYRWIKNGEWERFRWPA